jgi:RHS repeat-associated protein
MLTVSESSQTYSYLHDGQRNARLLTEAGSVTDSYAFDAFGNLVGSTGTTSNPYLYTGEQFDAGLGFTYLRARYYNPAIGRFVTRDPFAGFANDPVSLHKYLYAHANPANMIDPSGHFSLSEFSVVSAIQNTFRTSPVVAGIKTICAAKATADNITYAAMAKQVVDALKVLHYGYDVNQAGASGSIFNGQQSPIPGTSLRLEVEHPLSNFPTARKFLREGHIKKVVLKHLWKTGNQFHHVEPWLEFEVEPFVGGVLGAEFSYASASRFAETAALKGGHSLSVLTLDVCGIDYMEMALGLEGKISTNTGSGEITADAKWTILGFIEVKVGLAKATSDGDLELFPGLK